jgi:nucleoside-diphosphate-sugar epimerase
LFRLRAAPIASPYRIAHIARDFNFSIEKARRVLGYHPKIDWRTGLSKTVAAYRRYKESGVNEFREPPERRGSQ